jgi:translation initiation factor 3 subunit B
VREIVHHGIESATISPCERYIVSFSPNPRIKQGLYIVWSIETGEPIREFEKDPLAKENAQLFKWSYDGSYIAKMIEDHVCVYQLPDMKMILDSSQESRTSIRVKGIRNFIWSPMRNMFYADFVESEGAHP